MREVSRCGLFVLPFHHFCECNFNIVFKQISGPLGSISFKLFISPNKTHDHYYCLFFGLSGLRQNMFK